jgi:multicomponent Na+:H+ antiporter subunit E
LVAGLIVAGLVLASAAQMRPERTRATTPRINPIGVVIFLIYVLYKLIQANLILAWEIVTPRNRIRTGVVAVPLRTNSEIVMMLVANMVTLTPGTITLESRGKPPVLYVHVLHLDDADKTRRELYQLERIAIRAFGSPDARSQFAANVAAERETDAEAEKGARP